MTMHDIDQSRRQKLTHHCLVGYDPASERAVYSLKIPKSNTDLLQRFVHFESDDPAGYDCYKVEYFNVVRFLNLLGEDMKPPKQLEYFVEPWVPQYMNTLFDNAIQSIQLGIEDYQANDPKRALSAVGNFYAGVLLLAKETLVRAVPNANADDIIGANYRPMPDNKGGVQYRQVGYRTIDFDEIGKRFKDFRLQIDQTALRELNRVRNDIEHNYSAATPAAVRDAIGKAFPVAADLFRLAKEDPGTVLGESWSVMLDVKALYDKELAECRSTFSKVDWRLASLSEASPICPDCKSLLVEQLNSSNTDHQSAHAKCRACGTKITAEELIVETLATHFEYENYVAVKDGGESLLHHCPECGLEAYVMLDEENACAFCEFSLAGEACARCGEGLTPDNVSADNNGLCSYCDYVMSKDD
jgi:hypothetical protein